jgi:hypothetical protein
MNEVGFIVIARQIFDNPLLQDAEYFRAWVWLISNAAWKPRRVKITNGRALEIIEIGRGQITHSRSYMATAWGWSEKRVRTFLNRLKTDRMIDTQTGRLQTIITICNYDAYQIAIDDEGQQTGQQTGQQRASKGPEEERIKEEESIYPASKAAKNPKQWPSDGFDRWYAAYPKKVEKIAARKSFDKVQASGDVVFDILMAATAAYCEEMRTKERQYIKGPAVWLNKGCYLDERAPPKGTPILTISEPARDPQSFTESDWRDRLANNWAKGQWSGLWGPRPGEPGCHVPAHLLNGGAHV